MIQFQYRRTNTKGKECSRLEFRFTPDGGVHWSQWAGLVFPAWVCIASIRYVGFGAGEHKGKVFQAQFIGRDPRFL